MSAELSLDQQTRMVRALQARLAEDQRMHCDLIETHISFVLVCGPLAYKLKKALKTAFLDQSTLARRRRACDEELRLNRRLAPDLYLAVVCITGDVDTPAIDGAGSELDRAVKMRAFSQDGLWDRLAADRALDSARIDELVGILVPFHDAAAVAERSGRLGSPAQVRGPVVETLDDLDGMARSAPERSVLSELRAFETASFGRLRDVIVQRLADGRVRECHGDLHLGNVAQVDGQTLVFDCIDFNEDLRWTDVVSEVAFMAMDLHAHRLPSLAHAFVNGYLQASGDYDGVRMLRYYMVYRALVRAKVALLRAAQRGTSDARQPDRMARERAAAWRYVELALRFSRQATSASPVTLMITHGYSGSGKSTLTQSLLEASGAVRIRADVERKRLAGLAPLERGDARSAATLYAAAMTDATYARMRRLATCTLQAGFHTILDATFLQHAQRTDARGLARASGARFVILDFDVDTAILRQRVRARSVQGDDPSDADEAVLDAQLRSAQGLQSDELDAVFPCGSLAAAPVAPAPADWAPLLRRLAA